MKHNVEGGNNCYKAQLMARGFSQIHGIDFDEMDVNVTKFMSIRTMLVLGAILDLEIHQMDVKCAFFNGELYEGVYMMKLERFKVSRTTWILVCKLKKSIYGLKQSQKVWNTTINIFFKKNGFVRYQFGYSVYVVSIGITNAMFLVLYIDNLLIFSKNVKALDIVKKKLSRKFDMKDLGEVLYCLGMQII
jgi:hypothetical protein